MSARSRKPLIEWVKHIWRSDLSRDEKFDVRNFDNIGAKLPNNNAEWGW